MTATLPHPQKPSRLAITVVAISFPLVMALPCLLAGWLMFWLDQLALQPAHEIGVAGRLAPLTLAIVLITAWAGLLRLVAGSGGMWSAVCHHGRQTALAGLLLAITNLLITWHLLAHSLGWSPLDSQRRGGGRSRRYTVRTSFNSSG